MALLRVIKIKNGSRLVDFEIYRCDSCRLEINESDPHKKANKLHYCLDCSFKLGFINGDKYLDSGTGLNSGMFRAAINPTTKQIEVAWRKSKFSWEKTSKEHRHSPEYIAWRSSVFVRDDFTCQDCGERGKELNAHHIEHFAKNKQKRFLLSNGITLCLKCHKNKHKKRKVL